VRRDVLDVSRLDLEEEQVGIPGKLA